ncbi:MAG: bifunctional precorrin-2 dehydrogenase/sirohydrochlorin ferrochelatase [Dehalococcoidia bacterium]|nr:bifunctional precorrin-2 dehydrogenase/sirohydrochlorin ferrochelatase [Dehalococcoidia bacterium]
MNHSPVYYPAFITLTGKRCVVFGGGEVALRKVQGLVESKADVTVISPDLCAELAAMKERGTIMAVSREYKPGDLHGVFLAIAATDDKKVNADIGREAHQNGVLINVVDTPELCDFIVPSYFRRGDVTIAISTGGKSPALARKIRTRLEDEFGAEYSHLADLIGDVRTELKEHGARADADTWQSALDLDRLLALLKQDKVEQAKDLLRSALKTESRGK